MLSGYLFRIVCISVSVLLRDNSDQVWKWCYRKIRITCSWNITFCLAHAWSFLRPFCFLNFLFQEILGVFLHEWYKNCRSKISLFSAPRHTNSVGISLYVVVILYAWVEWCLAIIIEQLLKCTLILFDVKCYLTVYHLWNTVNIQKHIELFILTPIFFFWAFWLLTLCPISHQWLWLR